MYPPNHLNKEKKTLAKLIKGSNLPPVHLKFFLDFSIYINLHLYMSKVAVICLNINIPTIHRKHCGNNPQNVMSDFNVGETSSQAQISLDEYINECR